MATYRRILPCLLAIGLLLGCNSKSGDHEEDAEVEEIDAGWENGDGEVENGDAGEENGETTDTISRHGITWTFAEPVEYGRFVNGDYWVVGPLTVIDIDPAPIMDRVITDTYCRYHGGSDDIVRCVDFPEPFEGEYGYSDLCIEYECVYVLMRNGSAVNPMPGSSQTYDSRIGSLAYEDAVSLPIELLPNSSLLSSRSNPDDRDCDLETERPGWTDFQGVCHRDRYLRTAAVLTVLDEPPPEGSFRPAYTGEEKVLHNADDLRIDLLTDLEPVGSPPDIVSLTERFSRVRLDDRTGWTAERMQPIDAVGGYGAGLVRTMGHAGLSLLIDQDPDEKRALLIQFVQTGIDLFGSLLNGNNWHGDGGHGSGRKFPIVFAGLMLGVGEMERVVDFPLAPGQRFQEDCQTYYDFVDFPFFYGVEGFPRWGIRHCQDLSGSNSSFHDESNGYRTCCNSQSWVGQTLTMRLLGIESLWDHQPYFDYMDRWMQTEGDGHWGSAFADAMWHHYRPTIDTCKNDVWDRCSSLCDPDDGTMLGEEGIDCGDVCTSPCE